MICLRYDLKNMIAMRRTLYLFFAYCLASCVNHGFAPPPPHNRPKQIFYVLHQYTPEDKIETSIAISDDLFEYFGVEQNEHAS